MTKTKILGLAAVALSALAVPASAQNYKIGLGGRLTPDGIGANAKFFMNPKMAIELQANVGGLGWYSSDGSSTTFAGIFEYHIPMPKREWQIFFGGGLHTGVWNHNGDWYYNDQRHDQNEFIFGINAIGGVEYKFKKIPLALSGDFRPAVNFVTEPKFFAHNMIGVAARYTFK